jgi:hypothetical protein
MKPKMKYNDPTAHAIDREYRIMKALKNTDIPGEFLFPFKLFFSSRCVLSLQ